MACCWLGRQGGVDKGYRITLLKRLILQTTGVDVPKHLTSSQVRALARHLVKGIEQQLKQGEALEKAAS